MDIEDFEPVKPPSSFPITSEETYNKRYRLWFFEAPTEFDFSKIDGKKFSIVEGKFIATDGSEDFTIEEVHSKTDVFALLPSKLNKWKLGKRLSKKFKITFIQSKTHESYPKKKEEEEEKDYLDLLPSPTSNKRIGNWKTVSFVSSRKKGIKNKKDNFPKFSRRGKKKYISFQASLGY